MVMTVEPGFGGQAFMADVAKAEAARRRASTSSHKLHGGEVHVDGGVNRETAELVGGLGVDILVVGSALWLKGRDMGREIRLIRALADEGYQYGLNKGVPPIPRDRMVTFASLRRPAGAPPARRGRGGRDPGAPVPLPRGPGRHGRRGPALGPARAGLGRGGGEGALRAAAHGRSRRPRPQAAAPPDAPTRRRA